MKNFPERTIIELKCRVRARHGAAGEARSKEFAWDAINQAVADSYLRLVAAKSG